MPTAVGAALSAHQPAVPVPIVANKEAPPPPVRLSTKPAHSAGSVVPSEQPRGGFSAAAGRPSRNSRPGSRLFVFFLCAAGLVTSAVQAADLASRTLLLDGALAGQAVIAVGERGIILRSTDEGHSWNQAKTPTIATLTGVSFGDAAHGWAVGHDALILGSTDGGATWVKEWQADNLADSFLDVLAIDAKHVIAVGAYGLYAASSDGGASWVRRKIIADDYHLNRISRGPNGTLYIAGEHGTVLRSDDRGDTWTAVTLPYEGSFYGVLPLAEDRLLAYGLRGRAYRSNDAGKTWLPVPTSRSELLATALQIDEHVVLLAGQIRTVLVSRDGGASFASAEGVTTNGVAELLRLPDGSVLSLGDAGVVRIDLPHFSAAPSSRAASQP